MEPPLHRPPTRPVVDTRGAIVNPLAEGEPIQLDDRVPVRHTDLVPDATYVSPGFEYLTDEHALPARVRGALRIVPAAERIRHATVQRAIGKELVPSDADLHGGHIVAVSLGGFASGPNLFPQAKNFNLSAYSRLERGWRNALAEGCAVEVDIALTLDDDPHFPEMIIVTYWEDGVEWEHVLLNEPHAQ